MWNKDARDRQTVLDIREAAENVSELVKGMSEEEFIQDRRTVWAVQHQLMILGEGVKRLSSKFRTTHLDIPWAPMARMRDRLIHGYDQVDLRVVWRVATRDLLAVQEALKGIVMDEPT